MLSTSTVKHGILQYVHVDERARTQTNDSVNYKHFLSWVFKFYRLEIPTYNTLHRRGKGRKNTRPIRM